MKRDSLALSGREFDLVVIGGGIAGAWTAYEAASRGLRAALIEREDFGQATSWSSLKTAHGGLRHLQRLDVAGFRESVSERRALLRIAPEIVRPLHFAVPATNAVDRWKFALGGIANDLLSFDRNDGVRADRHVGPSRVIDRAEAERIGAGALNADSVFVWQDAQIVYTERLLMAVLHAAVDAGATVLNYVHIESATRISSGFEIKARDMIGAHAVSLRPRFVINAAGGELESVARLFGTTSGEPSLIRGVNVVLGKSLAGELAIGSKDQERFLFLVPWREMTLLGTIYDSGRVPVEELVDELLVAARRAFPWADIASNDVRVVHSGHVPGAPNGEPIYRSRLITTPDLPLISILSAKYTTARATAEKVVNQTGERLSFPLRPSLSADTVLSMARPLGGSFDERLRFASESEMAVTKEDAWRGRLADGSTGAHVPARSTNQTPARGA